MSDDVRAVLLDIEGTTSSIAFVAEVLFPYAQKRLEGYVVSHRVELASLLAEVEAAEPGDPIATLRRWADEDRKATPLKTLQGMIWAEGYGDGALEGHVYPDTPRALERIHRSGVPIYIYSSGSVAAQRLLFRHSIAGDLTPLLAGYFDTTTGAKRDPSSYRAIARALDLPERAVRFVSDTLAEIEAARTAGMDALLMDRDGGTGDLTTLDQLLP